MKTPKVEQLLTWLYRIFTYAVPGGFLLWTCVIDTLIDKNLTWIDKISITGWFIMGLCIVLAIYFAGRYLAKKIQNVNNDILICADEALKSEQIAKKIKLESYKEMLSNFCIIAPVLVMTAVCTLVENQVISLRGVLLIITTAMCVGFGCNVGIQIRKNKKTK